MLARTGKWKWAKVQTFMSNHGDHGRVGNMMSIFPDGCNFVMKGTLVLWNNYKSNLLFLYDLFQSGVGYSVMRTVPVGQHPVITRFMKGIFSIKSALPKYNFTWDVGIVISYISKINTNSIKYLTQKLATLLVSA